METATTSETGLARDSYARAREVTNAQRSRLPTAALEALAGDVVKILAGRVRDHTKIGGYSEAAFQRFLEALLSDVPERAADLIEQAYLQGASLDTLYLDFLARGARELGTLWDEDRLDFVQVTVAVGHIYAIMRGLRPTRLAAQDPERHALFITMPGDDHRLGASIASDLFRSRGWQIDLLAPEDQDDAIDHLSRSNHSFVGVSASSEDQVSELVRLVLALHVARPDAFVIISGSIATSMPELCELVDADAVATTALEAIGKLEALIANRQAGARPVIRPD